MANKTVDFEQVQWLNFTIRAQDHGSPPRIAELPVYLRIVDVNDNNPVFLQPSYQVLNRTLRSKYQLLLIYLLHMCLISQNKNKKHVVTGSTCAYFTL